jgi:putative transposase
VAKIMRNAKLKSIRGYRKPRYKSGLPSVASPNRLQQVFTVSKPDVAWVTDITYIHSDQGSQFGSDDFISWCKDNCLEPSMSHRGNC